MGQIGRFIFLASSKPSQRLVMVISPGFLTSALSAGEALIGLLSFLQLPQVYFFCIDFSKPTAFKVFS
jgi:hypothetical protein